MDTNYLKKLKNCFIIYFNYYFKKSKDKIEGHFRLKFLLKGQT